MNLNVQGRTLESFSQGPFKYWKNTDIGKSWQVHRFFLTYWKFEYLHILNIPFKILSPSPLMYRINGQVWRSVINENDWKGLDITLSYKKYYVLKIYKILTCQRLICRKVKYDKTIACHLPTCLILAQKLKASLFRHEIKPPLPAQNNFYLLILIY